MCLCTLRTEAEPLFRGEGRALPKTTRLGTLSVVPSLDNTLTNLFNVKINNVGREVQQQQTHFADQTEQWSYTVGSEPDPSFGQADTDLATLENFFGRPIKVREYTWTEGITLFQNFNPWTLFFENPRVLNRIANYNLLRAKLHMRIMINGNGFYYGRALASYNPLPDLDEMTQDRAYFIQDTVAASQRPKVFLDPTNSQGGDLVLPFFWYKNALNIPDNEWRQMGEVNIRQIQGLKHANGDPTPVSISIFCWAEEVQLSIPTQQDPTDLVPQSSDEYGEGIVSKPAAAVAHMAGQLTSVPLIAPYARATEMAASAVSSIARLFGYSRPVMTATSVPFSPHLIGNLPNTSVTDQSTKLAFDLKQELTIDPRTMGLSNVDEMSIKSIATRESFITAFSWDINAPPGALLWNTEVSPVTWSQLNDELHLPACAFAALPFKYWRGTMKYRFQIVASAFHKGRLQIAFDPRLTGIGEYNTQQVYIIDLAKERDFTLEVGWSQEAGALQHRIPGTDTLPYSIFPFPTPTEERRNGIVSVRILNELTSPSNLVNNSIEVNVFVSAGDDFEVFVPDEKILSFYTLWNTTPPAQALVGGNAEITPVDEVPVKEDEVLDPQSSDAIMNHPDADLTQDENAPMKMESSTQMAPTPSHTDCFTHVYFGDPVTSFRQCLKRYALHSHVCKIDAGNDFMRIRTPNFPSYRGYDPNGKERATGNVPYNYCQTTLLNYVTSAFAARRGGLRWKYAFAGSNPDGFNSNIFLSRETTSPTGYEIVSQAIQTVSNSSRSQRTRQYFERFPSMWDGGIVTPMDQNPVLEAELPYFLNRRFSPAKRLNVNTLTDEFDQFHQLFINWPAVNGSCSAAAAFVSTGEDFTLNFFTGVPVLYTQSPSTEPTAQS